MNIDDNTKPKTEWTTIICLDIPWLPLKVWPVFGARGEIKHTSLTSPPPCFPGNFMEALKKFHQSFRTPKNAFWTPRNGFSAPSFHPKIEIWHQKRGFPTPNFLFRAPASRCTKNGQTHPCTRFALVVHQYPPRAPKTGQTFLSQPGAWQEIYIYVLYYIIYICISKVQVPTGVFYYYSTVHMSLFIASLPEKKKKANVSEIMFQWGKDRCYLSNNYFRVGLRTKVILPT